MENYYTVQNSGIVILNNYIPILFNRLELTVEHRFKDRQCQERAVLYLQYLATGIENNTGAHLVLNKILCGLQPDDTINEVLSITKSEKELIEGLLKAMITYWPVIGQSSVAGLQENWLARDGMRGEEGEQWTLHVNRRAYDVLLARSPFSFNILRFRWMKKALHVLWNY